MRDVPQINMSLRQLDAGLDLRRDAGTGEADVKYVGSRDMNGSKDRTVGKGHILLVAERGTSQGDGGGMVKEAGKEVKQHGVKGSIILREKEFKERGAFA